MKRQTIKITEEISVRKAYYPDMWTILYNGKVSGSTNYPEGLLVLLK